MKKEPSQRTIRKRIPLLLPVRKQLAKGTNLNSFATINSTFFNQKGETIINFADVHKSRICLAGLGRKKYDKVAYFLDYPFYFALRRDRQVNEFIKSHKTYLRWIFRESCWKDVFLTKNLKEIAKLGVVYSVRKPAQFVVQGAMLTRYVSEFPNTVKMWNACQKYVDGHIAMCMAHSMRLRMGGKTFNFSVDCTPNSNHQAWKHKEIGPAEIKKIISCSSNLSSLPPMSKNQKYRNMNCIWNGISPSKDIFSSNTPIKNQFKFPKVGGTRKEVGGAWGANTTINVFEMKDVKKVVKEFCRINDLMEFYHG